MPPFAPGDPTTTSRPLDVAFTQLTVREDNGRPNRGPQVDRYLRFCRLDPAKAMAGGYAWCAAFVVWCCAQANHPLPRTASVAKLHEQTIDLRVAEPEPGDVFLHLSADGKHSHTGFVVQVLDDGQLQTLEGNTNEAGGREGVAVMLKTRPMSYATVFIRPQPNAI